MSGVVNIENTTKLVKTVSELEPGEQGYETASKIGRRNRMRDIEKAIQAKWESEKTFEEDAAAVDDGQETYFCNFPYPYMNGRLHLGHAFTITKADFSAGYQRLKGKKVLFPFAFHCTGMPIQAAANKLKREIQELYGLEQLREGRFELLPQLQLADEPHKAEAQQGHTDIDPITAAANKAKGGKTKALAKTGNVKGKRAKTQWEILQMCSVPDEEIPDFQDPQHWLHYFPPHGVSDLKLFGVQVDWRRSFITTDTNPYYDSFVQWQFRLLKKQNKIAFGKRATVYSQRDRQACMDHDRATGEGKGPQEYVLIKMALLPQGVHKLIQRVPAMAAATATEATIYFVAATLRAETMYGQTNCFVLPEGEYGAYRMRDNEVFICSQHAAVNLAHQAGAAEGNRTAVWGKSDCISLVTGRDLLGLPLSAPCAQYDKIYTLPLLTISMTKGTGVVTSVPSDAPDDYAALRDMQTKPDLRQQYGIEESMVKDYHPLPIIRIPGGDEEVLGLADFGDMAAVTACLHLGVKDQHDASKLAKIKKSVYNKGFYAGVMTVGSQTGKKVEEAKDLVKQELLDANQALRYWEPEEEIMSRSGDKCVIAFIDQWFLTYGEDEWKKAVMAHVAEATDGAENTFEAYGVRNEYINTLEWLGNWACSRSFGLGTKVPWDPQFVVESLSDSTIYMAYYTIAHLVQGPNNIEGEVAKAPIPVPNDDVWNYVFLQGSKPSSTDIPSATLEQMRREFDCWYPFNLRVSGKDLIRNHLTMSLYNHAAIWPDSPEKWPKSFYTNGHVMVDNSKMSKSAGNFISLIDAIQGDNVHLHVPVEKKKINKVTLKASADSDVAQCTTKKPHGLVVGNTVIISKTLNNNGVKTITEVPSGTEFTISPGGGLDSSNSAVVESTVKNWDAHEWRAQSWTTDSVRYALSCAGDSMSDANFESDNANGVILTLDNELEWMTKVLASDNNLLRTGEQMTIQDKLFLIRMDECITEADHFYADMKFSMAIKFAFNDMRNHRKSYRDYHEKCGLQMHADVVHTFCKRLVIMISPVMTHWSEHVWCNVLHNKKGSVTRASWPATSGQPKELLLQDKYLQDLVNSFRKTLTKKKKGKAAAAATGKKKAVILVQSEYPAWKKRTLEWLASQWDDDKNAFAVDLKIIKASAKELQQSDDLLKSERAFMGVVNYVMGQASSMGKIALSTSMPFDESLLLQESHAYLQTSLELETLDIVSVADSSSLEAVTDEHRSKAEPGSPALCVFN